ncbi:hypothetical protein FY136_13265 [Agrobacterium tumefaciens]|uniref:hypothetical protein n=1 Tax=Agrobacterium tumefaciens TaxID=358 RepID=UPI0021D0FF5B|nr:hypothetical protein [Agrobacterium tumefaciens]UXT50158.1 hypothetical protein FY136_13265 [Agrobacterium tumefaciens]
MRTKTFLAALTTSKGVAVLTLMLVAASCSAQSDSILGKFRDPAGTTVEFLNDGTVIFVGQGRQYLWKWAKYDGDRIKLEPGPGLEASPKICNYRFEGSTTLRLTGCGELSSVLTRM